VTKFVTKAEQFFAIVAIAAALLFVCGPATAAEKKGAPEKKAPPVATNPANPGEEYAVCSPDYSDKQILAMAKFVGQLSPELVLKVRPILLKCDFKVNDRLLTTIAEIQDEMDEIEFTSPEQEKEFRQEKAKEIEIQVVLTQKPVNQAELKKLVGDLFEIRQRSMKSALADLEKEAELLKKRIEERQKLKDGITERKAKEIVSGEQPESDDKEPPKDPLAWD
jgi:hypothetical protein